MSKRKGYQTLKIELPDALVERMDSEIQRFSGKQPEKGAREPAKSIRYENSGFSACVEAKGSLIAALDEICAKIRGASTLADAQYMALWLLGYGVGENKQKTNALGREEPDEPIKWTFPNGGGTVEAALTKEVRPARPTRRARKSREKNRETRSGLSEIAKAFCNY